MGEIARKGTTKYKSNKQEKKVAKEVGGKEVIASGSLWFAPSDVRTDEFLIECKTTEKDYYILRQKTWDKIHREAMSDGMRVPVMQIQLEDGADEIVVLNILDFIGLDLDKGETFIGGEQPILLGDRMSFRVTSDFIYAEENNINKGRYCARQDVKLIDYDLHLVMLEWSDFLRILNKREEL